MESIFDYIEMLEDILDSSKAMPFSNKVSIEKERIHDIIDEMRLNIPNEIRQAQRIIEDHDKIIQDAKNKSAQIIKDASAQAHGLVDDHSIYKLAVDQAQELMDETKKNARDMRLSSVDYADEILSRTETTVRGAMEAIDAHNRAIQEDFIETINMLYSNRQELRGNKG